LRPPERALRQGARSTAPEPLIGVRTVTSAMEIHDNLWTILDGRMKDLQLTDYTLG